MMLSKNFSLKEMIKSGTATRLGLDNTPNEEQIENLKALCENILEPLREYYESRPIMISSGFRSEKLSEAMVDVSSIKEVVKRWHPHLVDGYKKQGGHRAMADVIDSIHELKYYKNHLFIPET